MESFIILAFAAGVSAVVVWWAMGQPGGRTKPVKTGPLPRVLPEQEQPAERFVLLPTETPLPADDRPSSALSVVRLAVTIAVFAVLAVGVLTALGFVIKSQLDRYFSGL